MTMVTSKLARHTALIVIVLSASVFSAPCPPFTHLGSEKRSTKYRYEGEIENPLCDYYIDEDVWYSLEARTGSEIPETNSVDAFHCGTESPVFIKARPEGGRYHDIAQNTETDTNAVVCANYGVPGNPCSWTSTIVIRYCDNRFIYKLRRPDGCSVSYCAGEKEACRPGHVWNNVAKACMKGAPIMSRPVLRGPVIARHETVLVKGNSEVTVEQFSFYCDVGYDQTTEDNGARFLVKVVFDGVASAVTFDLNATRTSVEITETDLIGNFGKSLGCVVQSYWATDEQVITYSTAMESNSAWIGIQVPATNIVSDNVATVQFTSTVPVTCWHCFLDKTMAQIHCEKHCYYDFELISAGGTLMRNCFVRIDSKTRGGSLQVRIAQNADKPLDAALYQISFKPFDQKVQFAKVLWRNYRIPNAMIHVNNKHVQTCSSTGDPHIYTVTGSRFDNYLIGDLELMASDPQYTDLLLMIQARHTTCSQVSCNCGVIAREGNSVIGVDYCKRPGDTVHKPPRVIRYLNSDTHDDGSSVWRDNSGNTIKIVMPSGLMVTATIWPWIDGSYINIAINVPAKYVGKLKGMCTRTTQNAEFFRIQRGESLFDTPPTCKPVPGVEAALCDCQGTSECSVTSRGPLGAAVKVRPLDTKLQCRGAERRRRSTTEDSEDNAIDLADAFYTVDYDPQHGVHVTKGTKTDAEARGHCHGVLRKSAAYEQCSSKVDLDGLLDNCKEDVQIFDDYAAAVGYGTAMEKMCLDYVVAHSNATTMEELVDDPIVTAVTDVMCPSQCNQRGACRNGTCLCESNYAGPDCSIDKFSPPHVDALYHGALCDLQSRRCATTTFYASNVYDLNRLKCRFESFSLLTRASADVVETVGKLNVANEVICPLPDNLSPDNGRRHSSGYQLSISSDGQLYSNKMTLTVYDSLCLNCSESGTCQIKDETCFIAGICHAAGEGQNTSANCLECVPDMDSKNWIDTCRATALDSPNTWLYWLLLPLILVLGLAVVVAICYRRKVADKDRDRKPGDDRKSAEYDCHPGDDGTYEELVDKAPESCYELVDDKQGPVDYEDVDNVRDSTAPQQTSPRKKVDLSSPVSINYYCRPPAV